jgi:hypothetical protein
VRAAVERTVPAPAERVAVPGVLLLYEDPLVRDAATVREHVDAFARHSRFAWYPVNLTFGFPSRLAGYEFAACVFHYSIRPTYRTLTDEWRRYLWASAAHRVAIFQDEIWHFRERERFLTDFRIDCLYSRHKPHHVRDVYGPDLPVREYVHYLAGYVSDNLVARAARLARPLPDRPIDVGYRGRRLPYYFGRGGQEKGEIAEQFARLTTGRGLRLDLASGETERLYGEDWDRFLSGCKAVLGVEGGVSVVDRSGRFRELYERLLKENPRLTPAEFEAAAGPEFRALEDRIDYRCLTPRHFESAAFRNLQILFEGRYDGILQPWAHYVPLRKDFANLDEVLAVLADPARATSITDRAYADLIASEKYSYQGFVRSVDDRLAAAGPVGAVPEDLDRELRVYLAGWNRFQSRVWDFDVLTGKMFAADPVGAGRPVAAARALLAEYRRAVDARAPGERAGPAAWYRRAADRGFWAQVERWLGRPVPPRPEFDPDAGRPRSAAERLATVPAAAWRAARVYAAAAARRARRAFGRPTTA